MSRMPTEQTILEVQDLSIAYPISIGVVRAVEEVSFTLADGEALGLVGESGCGKSTLGLSILKLLRPPGRVTEGKIIYRGPTSSRMDKRALLKHARAEHLHDLPEPAHLAEPAYSPWSGISWRPSISTIPPCRGTRPWPRVGKMLGTLGIEGKRLKEYPHQLSGGMRQRIMIGLALIMNPDILIADEPTTSLDVIVEAGFTELLAALRRLYKLSIILITHNLGLVAEIADRIAVMYAGQIMEIAATEDIFARPLHPYTQGLIDCVPNILLDQKELVTMPGSPPDLVDPPAGAASRRAVRKVMPICREEAPALLEHAPRTRGRLLAVPDSRRGRLSKGRMTWRRLYRHRTWSRSSPFAARSSTSSPRTEERARGGPRHLLHRGRRGARPRGRKRLGQVHNGPAASPPHRADLGPRGVPGQGHHELPAARDGAPARQGADRVPGPQLLPQPAHERRAGHHASAHIHGIGTPAERRERVLDLMEKVGLSPAEFLYRKYPHQLSGGQSQRVVLARALVTKPDFLVADEPIAMADVSVRALILQLMRQLKQDMGLTYLFITHDLATAKYLCDRIAVMYLGQDRGARHAGRAVRQSAPPLHEGAPRRGAGSRSHGAPRQEPAEGRNPQRHQSALRLPLSSPLPVSPCRNAAKRGRRCARLPPGHFSACILDWTRAAPQLLACPALSFYHVHRAES